MNKGDKIAKVRCREGEEDEEESSSGNRRRRRRRNERNDPMKCTFWVELEVELSN